jgi:hypothetical protein
MATVVTPIGFGRRRGRGGRRAPHEVRRVELGPIHETNDDSVGKAVEPLQTTGEVGPHADPRAGGVPALFVRLGHRSADMPDRSGLHAGSAHTMERTTPPSTRRAAPLVAEARALQT